MAAAVLCGLSAVACCAVVVAAGGMIWIAFTKND